MQRRNFIGAIPPSTIILTGCLGESDSGTGQNQTTNSTASQNTTSEDQIMNYRITNMQTSFDNQRPDPLYILYISRIYGQDEIEGRTEEITITNVSDISEESVRRPIEIAILDSGWHSEDQPPDALSEQVEDTDVFMLDSDERGEAYFQLGLYHLTPGSPIAFEARITDEIIDQNGPGEVELSLTNVSSTRHRISGRNIKPFGVLYATAIDGGGRFLLWSNYEETECVSVDSDGVEVCFDTEPVYLDPGESISHRYELLSPTTNTYPELTVPSGTGTYKIDAELQYQDVPTAPHSTLKYESRFDIEGL